MAMEDSDSLSVYCPVCQEAYLTDEMADPNNFGTDYPHFFLATYPKLAKVPIK